ncbi:MAG: hypothetical protein A2289_00420 [Deltaproteobacteria bacterium RIFOXYA12_FULL_58_15]|nr:MAG: hypothetical protein A2289_00420 [Deltaproteobacteria bacterium RIFOXYA12_FULL_58_15]OGR12985.1 MAG: hypothetical protein A2341_20565 [Deltaproteobacteria bacterium RIFOXYB12_FULL_58_9]
MNNTCYSWTTNSATYHANTGLAGRSKVVPGDGYAALVTCDHASVRLYCLEYSGISSLARSTIRAGPEFSPGAPLLATRRSGYNRHLGR